MVEGLMPDWQFESAFGSDLALSIVAPSDLMGFAPYGRVTFSCLPKRK